MKVQSEGAGSSMPMVLAKSRMSWRSFCAKGRALAAKSLKKAMTSLGELAILGSSESVAKFAKPNN